MMRILLAGASGYIGQSVLRALLARGHDVVAPVRQEMEISHPKLTQMTGALEALSADHIGPVDHVVSCLASRSGGIRDAHRVDFQANMTLLDLAQSCKARRFTLLSAICVQRPMLSFQRAKLQFERALIDAPIDHSIIRPTAYFKSISGQVERVRQGKPFLIFGDGRETSCTPISRSDLAEFMVERLTDPAARNAILPIGGPGPALSARAQGELLCQAFGRPAKFRSVSPKIFDIIGTALWPLAQVSPWAQDRAEFMRIAKYYATQSMLVWDETAQRYDRALTPSTGHDRLEDYYAQLAAGQVDAPYLGAHKLF